MISYFLHYSLFLTIYFVYRILGSLSRPDCIRLRDAYDRLNFNRTLEQAFKSSITKGNLQKACVDLITPNSKLNPLGTDKESYDEEIECNNEGERAKLLAEANYSVTKVCSFGEEIIQLKNKGKLSFKPLNSLIPST